MRTLFSKNTWSQTFNESVQSAKTDVGRMTLAQLNDSAVSEALEKIVDECCFKVAVLKKPERGERRSDLMTGAVGTIHVAVPFSGAASSFDLMPTNGNNVNAEVYFNNNHTMQVVLQDNDNAPNALQGILQQVSNVLDLQRKDVEQSLPKLREEVSKAADARRALLENQKTRDSKFDFDIK